MRIQWILIPALAAILAVTAGCGGSGQAPAGGPEAPGEMAAGNAPEPAPGGDAAAPGGEPAEGPGEGPWAKADASAYKKTPSGLTYAVLKEGKGPGIENDTTAVMHYTGWLKDGGAKFDSSRDRGEPFRFHLGHGEVIRGWDEGVKGMKAGEQRQLILPPDLAYGDRGAGGAIPPGATLVFDVELVEIGAGASH